MTIKTVTDEKVPVLNLNMSIKKTMLNKENSQAGKKKGVVENEANVPVNCVAFAQNEKYMHQFATVDEHGRLAIWDTKKGVKHCEESKVTNGLLMTCAIEQREAKLVACGGIDTKLHIFSINPSGKKKEKLTLIEKVKELTGHYGLVTCCGFLSQNFLISGSNDSSIMLWDFEKPGRFLVKYVDH